MHQRARDLALRGLGRAVTTHPRTTLLFALVLAAGCVALVAWRLEFRTDRSDLVSTRLEWNRRYADYKVNFPRWNDFIVCLEGEADDQRIDELARTLAELLREAPPVEDADAGFTIAEASPRLFRIDRPEAFEGHLERLEAARRLAACATPTAALAVATAGLRESAANGAGDQLSRLAAVLDPYLAALEGAEPAFTWMTAGGLASAPAWQPFRSASGRLRFVQVRLRASDDANVSSLSAALTELRATIASILAATGSADVAWGVTGIPAIEADETGQSIRDSTLASIVAFALITALMIAVFRGVTVPLIAAGSLLVAMAWSFGWLIVSVGHLQLLSVVFTVILLGLGIDFALHIVARLELVQDDHEQLPDAMARVMGGVGPGLVTGAVTTAAAFGVVAFTDFKGMAEMGIIAGGGVLLCLIAMCTVFPAAIAATGRWKSIIRHRRGGESAHFAWGRLDWVDPHPGAVLAVAAVVVGALFAFALRVSYDPNVLNLHAPGVESVRWEARIVEDDAVSVWAALVRTEADGAATLADRLRDLPTVSAVGGMGVLFPAGRAEREARVDALRDRPAGAPVSTPGLAALRGSLAAVRTGLGARIGELEGAEATRGRDLLDRLETALVASGRLDEAGAARRWARLTAAWAPARAGLERMVVTALDGADITAADLPSSLREQWVGRDGSWLLQVYPAADPQGRSILDPDRLATFVAELRSVEAGVFGPPIQIHESSRLIVREYIKAACYAIAAILVVLLLDFRSLADTLCSLLPVSIGFLGAFGIMGLLGAPLNFANIIVMPIIFGIGVDAGVHMVHRWRTEPHGRPAGLSGGTGRGITLTMLTTMIGFGCMLLAHHRGIRSLGLVMLAGLGVTLVACCTVLPAILQLRLRVGGIAADEPP